MSKDYHPVFSCNACKHRYETFKESLECCPSEKVETVYKCPKCNYEHWDQYSAHLCCSAIKTKYSLPDGKDAYACKECNVIQKKEDADVCCENEKMIDFKEVKS